MTTASASCSAWRRRCRTRSGPPVRTRTARRPPRRRPRRAAPRGRRRPDRIGPAGSRGTARRRGRPRSPRVLAGAAVTRAERLLERRLAADGLRRQAGAAGDDLRRRSAGRPGRTARRAGGRPAPPTGPARPPTLAGRHEAPGGLAPSGVPAQRCSGLHAEAGRLRGRVLHGLVHRCPSARRRRRCASSTGHGARPRTVMSRQVRCAQPSRRDHAVGRALRVLRRPV